jgi:hypothetical protein
MMNVSSVFWDIKKELLWVEKHMFALGGGLPHSEKVFGLEVEVEVWVWDPPKSYEKQEILAFVVEFCA